ncbi:hypothetical protein AB1Y20_007154 [Prymnesium parvum]|uniref:Uncharacterized protein n=1 Tax=Prymnesium parvum TaxID=97485 RepID=A0AB34IXN5_PRYPA
MTEWQARRARARLVAAQAAAGAHFASPPPLSRREESRLPSQGFAKQEAQLQQVEQRIQTASARHAQLEEGEC